MRTDISQSQVYIESLLVAESLTKKKSRQFAIELGLERISLSASEGQLLSLLVRMHGCRKFVEIGTLTGLSAQYLLEGLTADGFLWTLEKSEIHAQKAQQAFEGHPREANVAVVVGDARETMRRLEIEGPFDGVFIDGNKAAYGDYLAWAEKNVRAGGLIIADNVFLAGAVWGEPDGQRFNDKQVRVLKDFNQRLADPQLYDGVIIPTKEGLSVAIKKF